ncbi:hypothetical protein T492DRAFT_836174 [Pavlovales sp. CCMP2436]|nr:hypothetical protein T492DRAFT_836174 [Pavlovales sp. CCMP2436]
MAAALEAVMSRKPPSETFRIVVSGDAYQMLYDWPSLDAERANTDTLYLPHLRFGRFASCEPNPLDEWQCFPLTLSFRMTKPIATFANAFWGREAAGDIVAGNANPAPLPVTLHLLKNYYGPEETVPGRGKINITCHKIACLVKACVEKYGIDEVVVIAATTGKPSKSSGFTPKSPLALLSDELAHPSHDLPTFVSASESTSRPHNRKGKLSIITSYKSKGIERKCVIYIGFEVYSDRVHDINQVCVSLTRASEELHIFTSVRCDIYPLEVRPGGAYPREREIGAKHAIEEMVKAGLLKTVNADEPQCGFSPARMLDMLVTVKNRTTTSLPAYQVTELTEHISLAMQDAFCAMVLPSMPTEPTPLADRCNYLHASQHGKQSRAVGHLVYDLSKFFGDAIPMFHHHTRHGTRHPNLALLEQRDGLIAKHQAFWDVSDAHPSFYVWAAIESAVLKQEPGAFNQESAVLYEFKHSSSDGAWIQRMQLAVYGAMRAIATGKVVKCVLLNTSTPSRLEFNVHPALAIEAMDMLILHAQVRKSPDERAARRRR